MNEFIFLSKAPKLSYSNQKVFLPKEVNEKIESHWNELISSGKSFRRGDVFTITEIKNKGGELEIEIALTDYAHYLATINGIIEEKYFCRVVHSSVMIETLDGKLVFGEMGGNTALPGRVQCIGGGITREDLMADGTTIDIEKNAAKEMAEEVGLLVGDKEQVQTFIPWAVVESGPQRFVGVVYWAKILMSLDQFLTYYSKFEKELREKGDSPELAGIISVEKNLENKEEWLAGLNKRIAEYLPIIFKNL